MIYNDVYISLFSDVYTDTCSWRANLIYKILIYREKEGMVLASVHDVVVVTPKTSKVHSSYTYNQKISLFFCLISSRRKYHIMPTKTTHAHL